MIRKVLSTFLLLFLAANSQSQTLNDRENVWVDSVYKSLTLDQRLGQLFIFPTHGNGNDTHVNAIKNIIDRYTLGGIHFLDGAPKSVVQKVKYLQQQTELPLITSIDVDKGLGEVLENALHMPNALTMGAITSDSLIYSLGRELGRQLHLLGINMAFHSGLISATAYENHGSFSSNSQLGVHKDSLFNSGLLNHNITLARNKFPGIVNDRTAKNRRDLIKENLSPFEITIKNGSQAIVVAPVTSALDTKTVTSLSANALDYLKNNMEFSGLVIADNFKDLKNYKPGKTEAMAILAGNDLVVSANVSSSIKQIKKLIRKRKLELTSLEQSVKKILSFKYNHQKPIVNEDNIDIKINRPEAQSLISKSHKEAVTVVNDGTLPIQSLDNKTFASVSFGNGDEFSKFLDKYAWFTHYKSDKIIDKSTASFNLYSYVIIGLFRQLTQAEFDFINSLENASIIICSFSNPYQLKSINKNATKVISYSKSRELQQVVPQVIFGALKAKGRLPLSISDDLPLASGQNTNILDRLSFAIPEEVEMDSRVLSKIDDIVAEAIQDHATPGCQVLVTRKGNVVFNKPYGYYTYDSIKQVNDNTIYDIASITKVAATTQAVMFLEERGMIDLDKKVSVYLSDLKGTNKENMTIRDILTHQAGLWPYLPFWKRTLRDSLNLDKYYKNEPKENFKYQISDALYASDLTRDSVWFWVKHSKLRKKEDKTPYDYRYSDMGYYMLQRLVESTLNQPMEEFLQQNFYDPLGLNTLSYLPLCKFSLNQIAPTEYDNYFRKNLVYGLVHDQGAAMMGGVAGHAGLFSNAIDLAKLMQMNLQDGTYGGQRYFMEGTVNRFTSTQYNSNRRGIGWDKPVVAEMNSPTSPYASKKTFGHSGFTGTAVWVDPEFDLVYVFLSNRIYPDASNRKLIKNNIRTRIQDLIYQSMWSYSIKYDGQVN